MGQRRVGDLGVVANLQIEELAVDVQAKASDNRVFRLHARIENERRGIEDTEVQLSSRSTNLTRREADLASLADSGRIDEYNAAVGGFNAEVDAYNRALRSQHEAIEAFNRRVDERNDLAAAYRELAAQIDTGGTPLPQR